MLHGPVRFSWKLLAAIIPPVVLAVSGMVWLQYQSARTELLTAINNELRYKAQSTATAIDDLLAQRFRDLLTLSESSLITDYYRNIDFDLLDEADAYRQELARYLKTFAARNRVYAQVLYLDAAGREIASARPRGRGAPPNHRADDYFREAKKAGPGGWWLSEIEDLQGIGPVVHYSKPIFDERGDFKGVVVLTYDLAQLREMLSNIQVGKRGGAFIEAPGGRRLEGRTLRVGKEELLRASSASRREPWTVVAEAPLEDFLGPLRTMRNAAAFTSFVGLAILISILLLLVRSMTRPIASLVAAAERIGSGDFSHRIGGSGKGDLRAVSDAFDEMARHLEENREKTTQLQSQLIQAEKLSAVGQLISSVAHELNNPLGAISGYVQLAQLEDASPTMREDLKRIYGNVIRCRKVVENLLFFVRQSRASREKVSLNDAVSSALDLLEYRLVKTEDVRVEREAAEPGPEVAGDFQQIVQIVVNLIGNACDAMESGVQRPEGKRLRIRTGAEGGKAFIEVQDNGPGVPPEVREKIFQPFFTTKEAGRGTGLGLSICRQIAREHGGDVFAGGDPRKGGVFRLELPVGSPEEFGRIEAREAPAAPPAVPGKRVLVADDEADIAEIISRVLTEDGDETRVARNGAEALALLDAGPYDLVVTDIEMEHAKGTDLYAALADRGAFPATKILFVTGDILNPKVLEFLSRTKSEYAVKPFEIEELRAAMRRLLAS